MAIYLKSVFALMVSMIISAIPAMALILSGSENVYHYAVSLLAMVILLIFVHRRLDPHQNGELSQASRELHYWQELRHAMSQLDVEAADLPFANKRIDELKVRIAELEMQPLWWKKGTSVV